MTKSAARFAVPCLLLLLASCAGPAKLARQSDEALAQGDLHKAYDRALRAIEKDPQNQLARDAYAAASRSVAADDRRRVLAAATADTLAAADMALDLRQFRAEVARHGTALDAAPDYDDAEHVILHAAAHRRYQAGRAAMTAHHPKAAVAEYTACLRYEEGHADAVARLDAAMRAATARVAILPFQDGVDVPGLSQEIADIVQGQVGQHAAHDLRFTQLVSADEIEHGMSVAQARNMGRDEALALGRHVGANWVVVGHFRGLRSSNNVTRQTLPLYRRTETTDDKGNKTERWSESAFDVVTRERDVTVTYDFDVLNVATGAVLAHREQPAHTVVRVVWTDFRPDDDCDRYALLAPDVRHADGERAKKVDAQWKDQLGSWNLKDLLQHARDQRSRSSWSSRYRGEFYGDTRQRPVWLGELPSENDMAFVALHEAWKPVLAALKDLDAKD